MAAAKQTISPKIEVVRPEEEDLIGSEVEEVPEEDPTVVFFPGTDRERSFRARRKLSRLVFLAMAEAERKKDMTRQASATLDLIRSIIHKDDWDDFYEFNIEEGLDEDELMAPISDYLEGQFGHPTNASESSSASPEGQKGRK